MPRLPSKVLVFDQLIDDYSDRQGHVDAGSKNASFGSFVWLGFPQSADNIPDARSRSAHLFEPGVSEDTQPSTDPLLIAKELGLAADMSVEDIAQIRRNFAQRNHPDRVSADLREIATIRMQTANALLDAFVPCYPKT